ncbi:shikimate dehydrogenase [Thalassotalea sp. LPB0316]|uniref:shikimate dehydrogenase n=1 Tax=Thalassotalea sp. LPB0316 TaxID=2769490 RepID=UPI0018675625|nr:shikimate dehydrogenase [Thalassotalea sp. LPB0316]QOL26416.1 shikimate dehydrogenase [Thalassotalea sp. LPB0316]
MDQYFVVGNPIKQSKSPVIHHLFAEQTKQSLNYDKKLIDDDDFEQAISRFKKANVKGVNVTAPFKERAFNLCDELSEFAAKAGAVNTLIIEEGKIKGDNTDGVGLVNDLLNHQVSLSGQRILILGAGGAAKGVVAPILDHQPSQLIIANRTLKRAQDIANQYPNKAIDVLTFDELANVSVDLIINATSAGLNGQSLPIPPSIITPSVICYDMTYGKELTPFLTFASQAGCEKLIDGLGMLVGQAAQSFYLWRGVMPQVKDVIDKLRAQM